MNTRIGISLILVLTGSLLFAQVDSVYVGRPVEKKQNTKKSLRSQEWRNSMTWGGNFHGWFGNPSFILLSPTVGFCPYKNVNVGFGIIYNYTSYKTYAGTYSQSIWGGHSYLRYTIAESYFFQVQYDKLYQPNLMSMFDPNDRIWVNYLMLGAGFRQRLGGNAALTTSLMYNLSPNPLSIYPSRVLLQFGVIGGF